MATDTRWLRPWLVVLVVAALIAALAGSAMIGPGMMGPGMMWGYGGSGAVGGWGMALGMLAMLAFWIALIAGVVLLVRWAAGQVSAPTDPASVLRIQIKSTGQGNFLNWNTQAGFIYQVQASADLSSEWVDVGSPRFAAGSSDAILLDGTTSSTYYRVKRLR